MLKSRTNHAREIADEVTHLTSSQKHHFVDAEAAYCQIRDLAKPHDIVLIEGSRAMKMERIIEAFQLKP
jgi:UDP-N-acetylmuramyl pentapeptide synthase